MLKQARLLAVCLAVVLGSVMLQAQSDPGPRGAQQEPAEPFKVWMPMSGGS